MFIFLARFVSVVLHPIIMPFIGMVIIFHSGTTLSIMDKHVMRLIYLVIGLLTFVLPLTIIPLLIHFKALKSIEMEDSKERILPYFITFLFYYLAHLLMSRLNINYYFSAYLFSAAILVLLILIISYFWKISTHMAGAGALAGLILSLSFELRTDLMYYLVILLFISGILGTARMKVRSHTPSQIYVGFLTGVIVVFGIIHLMYAYR